MNKAKQILKTIFGYDSFRPLQQEIISHVLSGKDTLVIMPTGSGKSLCYQIPALVFEGLTVVVSPLISLMKDQVEQLHEVGVKAVCLNSSLPRDVYHNNVIQIKKGAVKMLYAAPETLLMPGTLDLLKSVRVSCLTIDEAHCISEWGHDFRPEYRELEKARSLFPDAVCMALTATATPRVRKDIKNNLKFNDSSEFIASFDRDNLFLEIMPKDDPFEQICAFLENRKEESGIIYCFSRRQVDHLSVDLAAQGYSVRPYHAGLSDTVRKTNQELFIRDDARIMVATIAFGMGINKPNVRFVVHHDLPGNIESYYQQIGRAGRDGLNAHCLLLFGYGDMKKIEFFINQKSGKEARIARMHLNKLISFAESRICRRVPMLSYFGEKAQKTNCAMCDNCTEKSDDIDQTTEAQMFLSCVVRTEQLFGVNHIVDVLRGGNTQKVRKFSHEKLSTYGIGKALSKKEWLDLSRELVRRGYLIQDAEYGSLKVNDMGREVLKGAQPFYMQLRRKRTAVKRAYAEMDYDEALFDRLKNKRKALADIENIPPYAVFPDKTLIEMTVRYPRKMTELRAVFGIGEAKLKKYGAIFLTIIQEYCKENNISEKARHSKTRAKKRPSEKNKQYFKIAEAFNAGESVTELAARFNVKSGTVVSYLEKYRNSGYALRQDTFEDVLILSEDQKQQIEKCFTAMGDYRLAPVFEALEGAVSYEQLKTMRLFRQNDKKKETCENAS